MTAPLDQLGLHFTGVSLREEVPQGQVYSGTDATGTQVTIAVLAASVAAQPSMRNAFADVVWRHSVGSEPGRVTVYAADLHAARPWAAIRGQAGQPGAEQLLTALAGAAPTAAVPTAPVPPTASIPPPPPPLPPGHSPATPTPAHTPTFQAHGFPAPPHQGPGYQAPPHQPPHRQAGFPGGHPPPPARSRGPGPWVLGVVGAVLALGLMAVGVVVGMRALQDDPDPPITLPTAPPPVESPAAPESPAPQPTDDASGDEPTLRDVDLVTVAGPNWDPDEETYTMAFPGWPFAFRAPGDWDCLKGDPVSRFPGAEFWTCRDVLNDEQQRATLMLWECDADCDESEQQDKLDTWLDEPDQAVQWEDSPTYYVETEENGDRLYSVDLGHFTGVGADGLRWMVGVYVESPPDTREDVQKLLNDVISQSSG